MVASTLEDGTVTQALSATEAVAEVLSKGTRKPTFLKNVGLISSRSKATKSQLQRQVDAERAAKHELQSLVRDFQQLKEQSDADRIDLQGQFQEIRATQNVSQKAQENTVLLIQTLMKKVSAIEGSQAN